MTKVKVMLAIQCSRCEWERVLIFSEIASVQHAATYVLVCMCVVSLPWNSPISPPSHPSETKNPSRWNDTAIFHLTPTHYLISLVQMPLLRTGLNTLTFRPNPENSLAATSIPPCSSLSASFSTLNPSGVSSWWMGPPERVAGRVRSTLWNFSELVCRDRKRWNEATLAPSWETRQMKEKYVDGKKNLNVENTMQTVLS